MSTGTPINDNILASGTRTVTAPETIVNHPSCSGFDKFSSATMPSRASNPGNVIIALGFMHNDRAINQLAFVVTASFRTLRIPSTWRMQYDGGNQNSDFLTEVKRVQGLGAQMSTYTAIGNYDFNNGGWLKIVNSGVYFEPASGIPSALSQFTAQVGETMIKFIANFTNIFNSSQTSVELAGCCSENCQVSSDQCNVTVCGCVSGSFHCGNQFVSPNSVYGGFRFITQIIWNFSNTQGFGLMSVISADAVDLSPLLAPVDPYKCCTTVVDPSTAYAANTYERLKCQEQGRVAGNQSCQDTMISVCSQDMKLAGCINHCQLPDQKCDTNIMTPYCTAQCVNSDGSVKDICLPGNTQPGSEEIRSLCACFLSNNFYNTYYESLTSRVGGVPTSAVPICWYNDCAANIAGGILPDNIKQQGGLAGICPDVSQCISVGQVTNSGNITGNITIIPNNDCNFTNVTGTSTTTGTGTNTGTGTGSGFPWIWIIIGVVGGLLILGLIIYAFARSRRAPEIAQQPQYDYGAYGYPYDPYQTPLTAPAVGYAPPPAEFTPTVTPAV